MQSQNGKVTRKKRKELEMKNQQTFIKLVDNTNVQMQENDGI